MYLAAVVQLFRRRYVILWILLLAALPRLIHLDARPIGRQAWRQCDTASVARNFHQNGYRILYPQIDWAIPGYVEMEFPLYPWAVAQVYRATGESEALARLLAVVGSLATVYLMYLLVGRILGRRAGLWAAFLYAILPLSLFFGRAIMPESWMLAATAAGIYWFLRWTEEDSWSFFLLSALAVALACLLKLTSLYLGLPLLWLAWQRYGRHTLAQWRVWLHAFLAVVPSVLWYNHAYRLGKEFGASFQVLTAVGADKWGQWSLLLSPDFYSQVFLAHIGRRTLTVAGTVVFLVGLFLVRRTKLEKLFDVWLLAVVIVLLLANKGSYVHDYYSLPIMLPAIAFMAKVFDRGWPRYRRVLVTAACLIAALSALRYGRYLFEERALEQDGRPANRDLIVADQLAAHTSDGDLVISCNFTNPTWLYLARRRGFGKSCDQMGRQELLGLMDRGASYLVAWWPNFDGTRADGFAKHLQTYYDIVDDDDRVLLAKLRDPRLGDESSWAPAFTAEFKKSGLPEGWRISGGSWSVVDGALHGRRLRKGGQAIASPAFEGCTHCRVRASLMVERARGRRSQPRLSLQGWWSDEGTFVAVSLETKNDKLWFQQWEGGKLLQSVKIPAPLETGRGYALELRYDLLEFHLYLDDQLIFSTASRFSSAPFGTVAVRARAADIRVAQIEVLTPGALDFPD